MSGTPADHAGGTALRPGYPVSVVGIGADGWTGLGAAAQQAVTEAEVLFGSARQLALVPDSPARRVPWPTPLLPALPDMLGQWSDRRITVLASGDPMFYGIGVTLANLLGAAALRVLPQPSSASLACARLGWPLAQTPVISVVGRDPVTVLAELTEGRRLLVLSADQDTPAAIAELLTGAGFGDSGMTVLEQLGGPREHLSTGTARSWDRAPGDRLNLVAVECVADADHPRTTRLPGLADELYGGDGQLTKREVRALTVAALAPAPGEQLWDVGGGSGSIAIEWCRTDPACTATTFERVPARREQIARNAAALGVPGIRVRGEVLTELGRPDHGLRRPDAVFIGGGLTRAGLLDECLRQLRPGGRLVANAVTAESEALLTSAAAEHGGALRKFQIYRGEPLGGFTTWRPQLPVAQWSIRC